jgi:hypothetical protein
MKSDELNRIWNSGLGEKYCQSNIKNIDVLSIEKNIIYYRGKGKRLLLSASILLLTSLLISIATYILLTYLNIENIELPSIFSGVACLGVFILGARKIIIAVEFFGAAKKLCNYDLSGFDIENYVPNKKRLIHKSIEWGIMEGKLIVEDGKIKLAEDQTLHADEKNNSSVNCL